MLTRHHGPAAKIAAVVLAATVSRIQPLSEGASTHATDALSGFMLGNLHLAAMSSCPDSGLGPSCWAQMKE